MTSSLSSNASALMDDLTEVALNELVELCRKDPTKIQACIHVARTATVKPVAEGQEKDFHETYTKMYKVPKEFVRDYLAGLLPSDADFATKLKKADKGSDETCKQVLYASHRILPNSNWPKFMLKRQVWRDVMRQRHEKLGEMLKTIVFKTVADPKGHESLQVDWSKWGVFVLLPKDSLPKTCIQHCTGLVADLGEDTIDTDKYEIVKNWGLKCELHYKKWKIPFLDFFSAADQKKLRALDDAIKAEISALARDTERQRLAGQDSDSGDDSSASDAHATKSPTKVLTEAKITNRLRAKSTPPASKKRRVITS